MRPNLAWPVTYHVPDAHREMRGEAVLAGLVLKVHEDGSYDLVVFGRHGIPDWVERVPFGDGPGQCGAPPPPLSDEAAEK